MNTQLIYQDAPVQPKKVHFRTLDGAEETITLTELFDGKGARLEVGTAKAYVNLQDLLNAARFLGAKDITTTTTTK